WYHVALVLNNASTLSFYFDGVLQDTRPNFFQIPPHPGDFELARSSTNTRYPDCDVWTSAGTSEYCLDEITNNDPSVNYFGGRIYGFRIWDVVRTNEEINDNKDVLITDTSTSPGNQLIAFLANDSMNYLDNDGDIDIKPVESEVLNTNSFSNNEFRVFVESGFITVINQEPTVPDAMALYGIDGKMVISVNDTSEMPVAQLSTGIYILKIAKQGQSRTTKVVISNK
ncbi:MAG: T9SS type A sorting domain-containing protein, partial [Bacteroidota bacterium]